MRAAVRQFLVVGIAAHAVGVPGHGQSGAGCFLFQASGDGVELLFIGRLSAVAESNWKLNVADDDGFFLDDHGLFDHWSRRRW